VVFTDTSFLEFGILAGRLWNFGDGTTDTLALVQHQYSGSRDYHVGLRVQSDAGCTNFTSRLISLLSPPPVWLIPPDTLLCGDGALITFADTSGIMHQNYLWRFGDGDSLTTAEPTTSHVYRLGNFEATLTVTDGSSGCLQSDTSLLTVKPRPTAAFTWTPDSVSVYDGTFNFRNESYDGESLIVDWHWLFGDGSDTLAQSPTHRYSDTGWWHPRLVVTNLDGCSDTAQGEVRVFPELTFFIPNAFSPGYDHLNNTFRPVRRYGQSNGYLFQVYNRWGMLVFETEDPDNGWNGRLQNQGDDLPSGAYAWIITMRLDNGAPKTEKGMVMLVR
jgi:gliding motility-associated-like protein